MLTSVGEHAALIEAGSSDFVQPDAPQVGGITPFLQIAALADYKGRALAPHFVMEIHLHLSAAYPRTAWAEHVEWLEPMFNEHRGGLGLSLSEQTAAWTRDSAVFSSGPR